MKTNIILTILFIAISSSATFAQKNKGEPPIGNERTLKLRDRRTLLVLLRSEDEDIVKDLSGNDLALEYYHEMYKGYNEMIRIAVDEIWSDELDIEYKTLAEISELKKTTSASQYLVLYTLHEVSTPNGYHYDYEPPFTSKSILKLIKTGDNGLDWERNFRYKWDFQMGDQQLSSISTSLEFAALTDFITNPKIGTKAILQHALELDLEPGILEVTNEYYFALTYAKNYFKEVITNASKPKENYYTESAPELKDLILLINPGLFYKGDLQTTNAKYREKIEANTITENEFKDLYLFPYEFADSVKLNEIVTNPTDGYAYTLFFDNQLVILRSNDQKIIAIQEVPTGDSMYLQYGLLYSQIENLVNAIKQ